MIAMYEGTVVAVLETLVNDGPDRRVTTDPEAVADSDVPVIAVTDPDSRARTHLANERTFLAWLRTGITLIALGLATTQFLDAKLIAGAIAVVLVIAGMFLVITGRQRFLRSQSLIERGAALTDDGPITTATLLVLAVGVLAIVLVAVREV